MAPKVELFKIPLPRNKFTENGPSIKYRNFGDNILNFRKERITRSPSFCRKTTLITGGEDGIGVAPPSCKTGTFFPVSFGLNGGIIV